jgi:hypothetical protein
MRVNGPSHIDRNTEDMENTMRKLALILFTVLTAVLASAGSKASPKCPANYDLVGPVCQNGSTGDIALPN